MTNTPHINQTADIAETILLPGDPLRAKYIAENFLDNAKQFNSVRGALGFTGTYNGKDVSVMGTGMGIASIGIYSHELINIFGVKNLIRIGSCGAIQEDINVYDIILAMGAATDTNFADQFKLPGIFSATADWSLLEKAKNNADKLDISVRIGNILTSNYFYSDDTTSIPLWKKMGILAVEMETVALYQTASRYNAKALSVLTVSDNIVTDVQITAAERETGFNNMMKLALSMA